VKVFKNGILGVIFGCKVKETTESWRKLHNENFITGTLAIYYEDGQRSMRWMGHVGLQERQRERETRNTYRVLMGRPKERDCLKDLVIYTGNDIKMDLKESGWKKVAEYRDQHCNKLSGSIKYS